MIQTENIEMEISEKEKVFNWPALSGLILAAVCFGLTYFCTGLWIGIVCGLVLSIVGLVKGDHYSQKTFAIVSVSVVSVLLVFFIGWTIYDEYSSWYDIHGWWYKNR